MSNGNPCKARILSLDGKDVLCGIRDDNKPMTFRGTDWCSDKHRKLIAVLDPSVKVDGEK